MPNPIRSAIAAATSQFARDTPWSIVEPRTIAAVMSRRRRNTSAPRVSSGRKVRNRSLGSAKLVLAPAALTARSSPPSSAAVSCANAVHPTCCSSAV